MPLPSQLVYNDLSGEEVKHILAERFAALLNDIPYLQRHITLPRIRMSLVVKLECWADQPYPDTKQITDTLEIKSETTNAAASAAEPTAEVTRQTVIDASSKGDPPDKVREDHGLGVPTPTRGAIAIEDHVEGRRLIMPNGSIVDRTGQSPEARSNSTVVTQDFGPARDGRRDLSVKVQAPRGPVAPPVFRKEDQ